MQMESRKRPYSTISPESDEPQRRTKAQPVKIKPPRAYLSWSGCPSESLLIKWLEQPENYLRWKHARIPPKPKAHENKRTSKDRRESPSETTISVARAIIEYFERNGISSRDAYGIRNKIIHLEQTWKNAYNFLDPTGQEMGNVEEKTADPSTKEKVISICRHWDRLHPIFGLDLDLLRSRTPDDADLAKEQRLADDEREASSSSEKREITTVQVTPPAGGKTQNRAYFPWKGCPSEELLLTWLAQPDNYAVWKDSRKQEGQATYRGAHVKTAQRLLVEYFRKYGITCRDKEGVRNKLKGCENSWKKAYSFLNPEGRRVTDFRKKMKNKGIREKILSICPLWDRLHPIFSADDDLLPPQADESGDGDNSVGNAEDSSSASDPEPEVELPLPPPPPPPPQSPQKHQPQPKPNQIYLLQYSNKSAGLPTPVALNIPGLRSILPKPSQFGCEPSAQLTFAIETVPETPVMRSALPESYVEPPGFPAGEIASNLGHLEAELAQMQEDYDLAQSAKRVRSGERNLKLLVDYAKAKLQNEIVGNQLKFQKEEMEMRASETERKRVQEREDEEKRTAEAERIREHQIRMEQMAIQKEELRLRILEAENQKLLLEIQLAQAKTSSI